MFVWFSHVGRRGNANLHRSPAQVYIHNNTAVTDQDASRSRALELLMTTRFCLPGSSAKLVM